MHRCSFAGEGTPVTERNPNTNSDIKTVKAGYFEHVFEPEECSNGQAAGAFRVAPGRPLHHVAQVEGVAAGPRLGGVQLRRRGRWQSQGPLVHVAHLRKDARRRLLLFARPSG